MHPGGWQAPKDSPGCPEPPGRATCFWGLPCPEDSGSSHVSHQKGGVGGWAQREGGFPSPRPGSEEGGAPGFSAQGQVRGGSGHRESVPQGHGQCTGPAPTCGWGTACRSVPGAGLVCSCCPGVTIIFILKRVQVWTVSCMVAVETGTEQGCFIWQLSGGLTEAPDQSCPLFSLPLPAPLLPAFPPAPCPLPQAFLGLRERWTQPGTQPQKCSLALPSSPRPSRPQPPGLLFSPETPHFTLPDLALQSLPWLNSGSCPSLGPQPTRWRGPG